MENIFSLPYLRQKEERNDIKLAKKALKGDSSAYIELMKLHKVYLYKIAYSYVKDEQRALDILQEVTYKGLLNISKLKSPEFFKTWITKILINEAINVTKKDSKVVYLDEETSIASVNKSISVEERLDLYSAIDKLNENHKSVIILKYFNDMTIDNIAYTMDIPPNTVKSYLRRAKGTLGKILKEDYLDE